MDNYLSIINKLDSIKQDFVNENNKICDYESKINALLKTKDKILLENTTLVEQNQNLNDKVNSLNEELESFKKVSMIRYLNKQIQELKNKNEILERKVNFYRQNTDIRSESLSARNFDDITSSECNVDKYSEASDTEYEITEHLARLLNIPIETKLTASDANTRVREYISDNKLHCTKTLSIKYDWKLYQFLMIEGKEDVDAREYLVNLNKIIIENGFTKSQHNNDQYQEESKEIGNINEEELVEEGKEMVEDDEEQVEEFEVRKISKRYYYISSLDNSVYKAVKNKETKEYELGKKVGIFIDDKIIKN